MTWYQVQQIEEEQVVLESQGAHTSSQGGPERLSSRSQLLQQLKRTLTRGSTCPGSGRS